MANRQNGSSADRVQATLGFARNRNEERYRAWSMAHPEAVALFVEFARERMSLGRRFGIKALVERVRWEIPIRFTPTHRLFRLDNSWTAYLARDLLVIEPRLRHYITTRRVQGEA